MIFITMLKYLSKIFPIIEDLDQMFVYEKLMKVMLKKKRSVSFKYDDRLKHCSSVATRSLVKKKEGTSALIFVTSSYFILLNHCNIFLLELI